MAHDVARPAVRGRLDPPQTRVLVVGFVLGGDPFAEVPAPPTVAVSRLGADRWLAIAEPADDGLADRLKDALGGRAAVVDVTDAHRLLRLTGPAVDAVLARVIRLDQGAIGPGVLQTEMMGMAVQVRAPEPGVVDLSLPRSAAASLLSAVAHAAAAYGWILEAH